MPGICYISAMKDKLIIIALMLAIFLPMTFGCGYTLEGRGSLLPPHILRVGIPTLENKTTMASLGEIVTSEIYSQFISRGNFQVLSTDTGVDAILEGEVTSYTLTPKAIDEEGVVTSFVITIYANVSFRDLVEDKVIWEQKSYRFSSEYQLSDAGGDFVTQEMESVRLAAKDLAENLVASVLTGF